MHAHHYPYVVQSVSLIDVKRSGFNRPNIHTLHVTVKKKAKESLNRPSLWIKFFFEPVCLVSRFNLALVKRLAGLFLVTQAVAWRDFSSFRRTSTVVWRDRDWPVRAE
jgi:hypothetical protein